MHLKTWLKQNYFVNIDENFHAVENYLSDLLVAAV